MPLRYSIIDLVDVTDFYLLLFEEDFFPVFDEHDGLNIRAVQRSQSFSGLCDWEIVRVIWMLAFVATTFGSILDSLLLGVCEKMKLRHLARWSEIPGGMRFWQLYVIKREQEKIHKSNEGMSTTGPYPASWQAAKSYFEFNLPLKKNQQAFSAAVRSLLFVEAPFLYWRLYCSEKYGTTFATSSFVLIFGEEFNRPLLSSADISNFVFSVKHVDNLC